MSTTQRLGPDEIRTLFLFESLDEAQLGWLSERGRVEQHGAGAVVFAEGADATCFFVLVEGTIVMRRRVEGTDLELARTNQRGVYAGATQAYVSAAGQGRYAATLEAVTDCRFFVIAAEVFAEMVRQWFPMAMHLLEGLYLGLNNSQTLVGQRERLLSLGRLSAGLTHELNNPAAAAVRATAALRERVAKMRRKLAHLAGGKLDTEALIRLTAVQEEAVERLAKAPRLTPMQAADAEDELIGWLDGRGLDGGWQLAPTLVAAGVDVAWLERVAATIPAEHLGNGLGWVTYALETEMLMNEIYDATNRISALVGAAKQYSQLDRAAHQNVDVHDGLDSTLVMLGGKLRGAGAGAGITVVKEYDRDLPLVPAYPAELNQVWTNLVDNAIAAMSGAGTLTVRTGLDGECLLVQICDTGPGVPAELSQRIFEPFFTTKPVGEGTGLGLDISYRIVAQRHGGDLRVVSRPGDTRFEVRLPLREPPAEVL